MEIKDLLVQMNDLPHVSGHESQLTQLLEKVFSPYADVSVDNLGNFIAHKKGKGQGPKLMFMAHMDEIGLMVSVITDRGFVKVSAIGGIDDRNLLGQEVIIHGREKVFGVIGIKPPHLTAEVEQKKTIPLHDMFVDTGYEKEDLEKLVKPGDIITFKQGVVELKNNKLSCKSFDNIAAVAALYQAIINLKDYQHEADVYFVASAQEEVGCRGGKIATYHLEPDVGIAVDVTFGRTIGLDELESFPLGKGPVLSIGPTITRNLFEELKEVATKNHLPYEVDVCPTRTGTDADSIFTGPGGVRTGIINIPLKYMHSTVETLSLKDVEITAKLISDYVISLNGKEKEVSKCS